MARFFRLITTGGRTGNNAGTPAVSFPITTRNAGSPGIRTITRTEAATMARYGTETTLPPRRVLHMARAFFGPSGEVGLALAKDSLTEIGFAGGGGGVEVSAHPRPGDPRRTDVTILSREFDHFAEQFLGILSDAAPKPTLLNRLAQVFKRGPV